METKIIKSVLLIFVIISALSFVCAQELSISRSAVSSVTAGSSFIETVQIRNIGNKEVSVTLTEKVPFSVRVIEPREYITSENMEGLIALSITRTMTLKPSEQKELQNIFEAGRAGSTVFRPIIVKMDNGEVESKELFLDILCNSNGICESENDENYLNCPTDCDSGLEDNACDFQKDGLCDPDCVFGDPDCREYCGDKICQDGKENELNCPDDCTLGQKPLPAEEKVNYFGIACLIILFALVFDWILRNRKGKKKTKRRN